MAAKPKSKPRVSLTWSLLCSSHSNSRSCKGCRGIAGAFCYLGYEARIGYFFEDVGLEFGLKPVRGLAEVEPRWRQEAEQLDRAGDPCGSGGSLADDLQSPRPTGSCCLIGSASRRPRAPGSMMSRQSKVGPMNSMERGMAKQDRAGVCIHRLAHAPQLIGQGQRFRNSHRPPARRAPASSGVSTATGSWLVKDVMASSVAEENTTSLLQFSDQVSSFQATTSSSTFRIPGRSSLENSWYRSNNCAFKSSRSSPCDQ